MAEVVSTPDTTVLICDLGNVVLPLDLTRAYRALATNGDVDNTRQCVQRVLRETGMGQGMCSPEAFYARLRDDLGLTMPYDRFRLAWSDIFWEAPETVALVRRARVKRRYLLSNTEPIHWEWITARFPETLAPFDRLFVSHEMGLEKPDPRIYQWVIRESGEPPEAHLFVDDILENVEGARAVGMQGLLFTGHDAFNEELRRRGLV